MMDRVYHQFSCPQPILDPFEDLQEWDRHHKLRLDKNTRDSWIIRHAAYWALWESWDENGVVEPDGVPIVE